MRGHSKSASIGMEYSLKRRWRLWLLLVLLLVVGGLLLVPQVRWPVYGWLRGEAFYQRMPTSYWRNEITRPNYDIEEQSWTDRLTDLVGVARNDGSLVIPTELLNDDPTVIPVLIELLKSGDSEVQFIACLVLTHIHVEDNVAVVPALREAAMSSDEWVRTAATQALKAIDPEAAAKAGIE